MALTCLELVQSALYDIGVTPPSSIVSTTIEQRQLKNILYAEARHLRGTRIFPQCKKTYSFQLTENRDKYPLPPDYYASLLGTQWDTSNKFPMIGPLSDADFDYRLYGVVSFENQVAYRIFGPDINPTTGGGQFQVNPKPSSLNDTCAFDYISKTMFLPPNFAFSTVYATGVKVNANGYIYTTKAPGGGTSSATIVPNMKQGPDYSSMRDNTTEWAFCPDWAATTIYKVNDFVNHSSNIYKCTTAGVSGGVGPVGTSGTETDGTVVWTFMSTPIAWAAGETYEADEDNVLSYVTANSKFYRCITSGISGATAINFNRTEVVNGTVTFTFQTDAQEDIALDSYLSLFDDDVMIAGIKWRYQQSKNLDFSAAFAEHEQLVGNSRARWNGSYKVSLAIPQTRVPSPNIEEGNWDIGSGQS